MSKEQDSDEVFLKQYENELALQQQQQSTNNAMAYSPAMLQSQGKQNLVEYQLDFSSEIQNIERNLRNDILVIDKDGNECWQQNPDPSKIPLNPLGVNDILKKIRLLINKNKVLSNYDEEQITARVSLICHTINDMIFLNYEFYGMDNEYKKNCYSSLVIDLNDMIEAAYRRALNGEERRDLNQARIVTQNEPMMGNQMPMYAPQQKSGISKLLPWRWGT